MAFKMKNQSMAKMVKAAGDSRVAMKMKAESAMKKELVGDQGNLPPELKAKIEAAPSKMKSAMKKTDDEMDRLMKIKRNTDPNDRDAVREINEKIRAHSRKMQIDAAKEETGGPRAKMKEKSPSAMKKNGDEAKIKALQARLAKAKKEGNDREINAIRLELQQLYKVEKKAKDNSPAKMQSAMKKEGGTITAFGKKYTYANAEEKKALLAKFRAMSQEKKAKEDKEKNDKNKRIVDSMKAEDQKYTDLVNQDTEKSLNEAEKLLNSIGSFRKSGSIGKEKARREAEKKGGSAVPMKRKGDGKLKTQPGTTRITDKDLDKKQKIEDAANKGDKKAMILRRYQALGPKALTAEELKMIGK